MYQSCLDAKAAIRMSYGMTCLALILRLGKATAAFAVILVLGLSLPSAAHTVSGHHSPKTMGMTAVDLMGAEQASHDGSDKNQTLPADSASCCPGACVALDVLMIQSCHVFQQYVIRWTVAEAKLPSLDLITLLRPPKT